MRAKDQTLVNFELWEIIQLDQLAILLTAKRGESRASSQDCTFPKTGGGKGIRTPDPLHAMQVLYQLSYTPKELLMLAVRFLSLFIDVYDYQLE